MTIRKEVLDGLTGELKNPEAEIDKLHAIIHIPIYIFKIGNLL
jgi:hypothetical protein